MRIIVAPSHSEANQIMASMILDKLNSQPKAVLGLATGKTMIPVYSEFVTLVKKAKRLKLQDVHFFM